MQVGIFSKKGRVDIIGALDVTASEGFIEMAGRTYVIECVVDRQLVIVSDVTELASGEEDAVETSCENGVTCPYCAFTHAPDCFLAEEAEQLAHCGSCGSVIAISAVVITTYCAAPVKKAATIEVKGCVHA